MKELWVKVKNYKPNLVWSCIFAAIFSTAALLSVSTDLGKYISPVIHYFVYVCAAICLFLAVWAIVLFCRHCSPRRQLLALAQKNLLTARLVRDFSFRTIQFAYLSFALNILFALAKGVAGWFYSSWWLISLAAYYLILCISKIFLVSGSRKLEYLKNQRVQEQKEWKAYRICGILFLVMTLVLFGVVVLIVTEGNQFTYEGTLIFVVALYDFYCLVNSIVYMIRMRKWHSPIIVAIKTIGFATALVSMLSLQTAMFASFGTDSDTSYKNLMNLISGGFVCVLLFIIGIFMVIRSTKKIILLKSTEVCL